MLGRSVRGGVIKTLSRDLGVWIDWEVDFCVYKS